MVKRAAHALAVYSGMALNERGASLRSKYQRSRKRGEGQGRPCEV
jgi:hypothetical protein